MLEFTDGVRFDTSGELRIESRHDGLYVVGQGMLLAVETREEGRDLIASFRRNAERTKRVRRHEPWCPNCGERHPAGESCLYYDPDPVED